MKPDRERLERLLGGPERAGLRARLRRRFEQGRAADHALLNNLTAAERQALEGLLGRSPRLADSMRIELAELDRILRNAGLAANLRAALEALDGPIGDLARERAERAASWARVLGEDRDARLARLVDDGAGRGLVKRVSGNDPATGSRLLAAAGEVLARLPAPGAPRSRLAAEVLHDAHALDDGRPVATLVLAALKQADEEERSRELWARAGVLVNELASPVLVLNLPAAADTPGGAVAAAARARGEPLHLSLRALLRAPPRWDAAGHAIHVCENPAVVAIAADRLGAGCPPLVSTDGMPAAAQRSLLEQLQTGGALLFYHGDFDWPGIRIGNFVMRRFGARPWRFGAADYAPGAGRLLAGEPVAAGWDADLAPKMVAHRVAVDEEAVVESLIADLAGDAPSAQR